MVNAEIQAEIRRMFHVDHMTVHGISRGLRVSRDVVRRVLSIQRYNPQVLHKRFSKLDPFVPLIEEIVEKNPRIRATRLRALLMERGFSGSANIVRTALREGLRPKPKRAYQVLTSFPGEQAQVDWGSFGKIKIGCSKNSPRSADRMATANRKVRVQWCITCPWGLIFSIQT
jgi:transposase